MLSAYGAAAAPAGGDFNAWCASAAAQAQMQWAAAAQAQGLAAAGAGMWQQQEQASAMAAQQQQYQAAQESQAFGVPLPSIPTLEDRLGPPPCKGAGKQFGKEDDAPTARFLLVQLDPSITEEEIQNYFGTFAEIEEVTMRTLQSGMVMGSVKFAQPSMILRKIMLEETHKIRGLDVTVQTWKMQKMQKPGYLAKLEAMRGAKGKCKGKGKGKVKGGCEALQGAGWEAQGVWEAQALEGQVQEESMWAQAAAVPGAEMGFAEQMGLGAETGGWEGFAAGAEEGGAAAEGGAGWQGGGGAAGRRDKDYDISARYMLVGLTADVTEEAIRNYFCQYGEIEEVTLKHSTNHINGSVKFATPTMELRRAMLSKVHDIDGAQITVETWKMQKMRRPGFQAMMQAKGGCGKGGCWSDGWSGGCGKGALDGSWAAQQGGSSWAGSSGGGYGGQGGFAGGGGGAWAGGGGGCGAGGGYGAGFGAAGCGSGGGCGAALGIGCGAGGGGGGGEGDVTARYLLVDLPTDCTELELQEYFSAFAVIEEVTLKTLNSGKVMGSVKFVNPTAELRNIMFKEIHKLRGKRISVQTWKMQKLQKPGYVAKVAAERAAYKAQIGGGGGNARFHPYQGGGAAFHGGELSAPG